MSESDLRDAFRTVVEVRWEAAQEYIRAFDYVRVLSQLEMPILPLDVQRISFADARWNMAQKDWRVWTSRVKRYPGEGESSSR